MPSEKSAHTALRSDLRESAKKALALNDFLEYAIAVKTRESSNGNFHGKIDFSQPPWNAAVANVIMDLHAQARDAEQHLRLTLKLPYRPRGGSTNNTRKAIENILRLCEGADDAQVISSTKWIDSWYHKAFIAIGKEEAPQRLPRIEGEKERVCPCCQKRTLRMKPMTGTIWCIVKECVDENGDRPTAQLQYSKFTRQLELVWMNNWVGLP